MTSTTEQTAPASLADTVPLAELRAKFALRLATLYGTEVPAYNTLVDVSREVNEDVIAAVGADAERLGSIDRVTAERHGAIRVGSPLELAQAARVFAGFGMHPVGFYDLRDASKSSVPVVSTAFRPVDADELAQNPFRVFTSMLVTSDRRFFDEPTQQRLERFIGRAHAVRTGAARAGRPIGRSTAVWLPRTRSVTSTLATAAFELFTEPVDHDWYFTLEKISAVAADIGGVPSTHINHLTPRVLDIDDLYQRMAGARHRHDRRDPGPAATGTAPTCCCGRRRSKPWPSSASSGTPTAPSAQGRSGSGSVRSSSAASP